MTTELRIKDSKTGEILKSINVKGRSENTIQKIMFGLIRQMRDGLIIEEVTNEIQSKAQ